MTLYVCTAGTSIAGGPSGPAETPEAYQLRIEEKLQRVRSTNPSGNALLVRASAETNGLARADLQPGDDVAFLVSETEDGKICGRRLAALVESEVGCRATVVEIKGLQVTDGRAFRRIGINSLFDALDGLTSGRAPDEVRLNATGGFKGTVPYVVLYGIFRGFPVSYVYEFSDTLITLPSIPVEFDWERLMPAAEVVVAILDEGAIEEAEWRKLLPPDYFANQDRYDSLFELEGGLVTLSAVGLLMKTRLEETVETAEVFLSPQAKRSLEAAGPETRSHFNSMLERVRNPLHRSGFKHAESLHKTDLKVWKVYGSSGPRMLYWTTAGRVYVGELFAQHDGYESYANGSPLRCRDYDVKSFTEADTDARQDYRVLLDDMRRSDDEPAARARALEEEARALRIELQKARTERNQVRKSLHEEVSRAAEHAANKAERRTRSALDRAHSARLRAKDDEIVQLEALIEDLRSDIVGLRAQIFGAGEDMVPDSETK